jgi:hypothetical protein
MTRGLIGKGKVDAERMSIHPVRKSTTSASSGKSSANIQTVSANKNMSRAQMAHNTILGEFASHMME